MMSRLRFGQKHFAVAAVLAVSLCASVPEAAAQSCSYGGWLAIPGSDVFLSDPAATTFGDHVHVFATGTDSNIYVNVHGTGVWSGWSAVPGSGTFLGAPAATVFGGNLHVFARGTDSNIYENVQAGGVWSGWSAIPGAPGTLHFLGDPAATVLGDNVYVFARGINDISTAPDNVIYINVKSGAVWDGWFTTGGFASVHYLGDPAATPAPTLFGGSVHVWARLDNTRGAIFEGFFVPGVGSGTWLTYPRNINLFLGGPAAADFGDLVIFATGTDSTIYVNIWTNNSGLGAWSAVPGGGTFLGGPTATVSNGGLHLLARGTDSHIYINSCFQDDFPPDF